MSPSRRRNNKHDKRSARWSIVGAALLVALVAIYLLLAGQGAEVPTRSATSTQPALDDIDEKSRDAMRELLRDAGNED
jgi:hypothetical protein